ncbi:MAG: hypothetical protein Q9167_006627 [Letrouitia subvulpina]
MYDYLVKIILLGPSGCGKILLMVNIGRVLSSQTIGVEFASKIINVGTGTRRKRIKLQLWDTAGTERFRSVSRSYYRGAAGAILVYDLSSHDSFIGLTTFLNDARALASSNLTVFLAGNKSDLTSDMYPQGHDPDLIPSTPSSISSQLASPNDWNSTKGRRRRKASQSSTSLNFNPYQTATVANEETRQVSQEEASRWASRHSVPVSVEVSAYTGDGVEELFSRLARIILTKIELGEIDPDDPLSGIQYGDTRGWDDEGSVKSGLNMGEDGRRSRRTRTGGGWSSGMREWEAVFRLDGIGRRRDLCHHGIIPDPYRAKAEDSVQWVGEQTWIYKTSFWAPEHNASRAVLVFEGLDTYATIRLNEQEILKAENAFIPERVDVTQLLQKSSRNCLEITFQSALAVDLYFSSSIDESMELAEVSATAEIEGGVSNVRFEIQHNGLLVGSETVEVVNGIANAIFRIRNPHLWYPAKYGKQSLYFLNAAIIHDQLICDTFSKRFGLRKVKLVQKRLEGAPGTSFFFEVNHIPIFCGGSNWIPADMLIPRIGPAKYRDWMKLAIDCHHVMIRMWGGGFYEEDVFYDTCDEMGLLVWQDFMFACGAYPAFQDFLDSVNREATANIKRLRHHPSIVVWAGNNEDYQYCETEKLDYDPKDDQPQNWLKGTFPARYIYEKLLPDLMTGLIPGALYRYGSPFGGKQSSDPTVGDIHQWNGRFVSEFGMEAFPHIKTVDSYLEHGNHDLDRYPQSSTVDFHNKASFHERKLAIYLTENIQYKFHPLEYYIYCTQLMQAECLATAYRSWKHLWQGPGREYCAGALVWQLNDCWPGQSWSIIDYYLRPKLAYFVVKRELADITIGMKRVTASDQKKKQKYTPAHLKKTHKLQIWATNLTLGHRILALRVQTWDIMTGQKIACRSDTLPDFVLLPSNRSVEIDEFVLPALNVNGEDSFRIAVAAYLIDPATQQQVARSVNWPEPLKYVHLQRPKSLVCKIVSALGQSVVELEAEVPVKGVALEVAGDNVDKVKFDDNCVDLVPGEKVRIKIQGLGPGDEKSLGVRFLQGSKLD